MFGAIGFLGGIAAARDDRQGAFILDLLKHFLAVVSLVGGNREWRSGRVENICNDLAVVDLSAGTVKFSGRPFPSTTAWILVVRPPRLIPIARFCNPPFAPLAARWAFTIVLSMSYKLARDFDTSVLKICFQMPRRDQRLNRL